MKKWMILICALLSLLTFAAIEMYPFYRPAQEHLDPSHPEFNILKFRMLDYAALSKSGLSGKYKHYCELIEDVFKEGESSSIYDNSLMNSAGAFKVYNESGKVAYLFHHSHGELTLKLSSIYSYIGYYLEFELDSDGIVTHSHCRILNSPMEYEFAKRIVKESK